MIQYFKGSLLFGLFGVTMGYLFLGGMQAAFIVAILAILEVSLSFDNAVVNAKQLETMSSIWRHRFLTWGMIIAVFGMRIVFPLIIVSIVAAITPWDAARMAVMHPDVYAQTLTSAHINIAGFGMAFLMMVFLKFFFDKEKDIHWVTILEKHLPVLAETEIVFSLGTVYIISLFLPAVATNGFLISGMAGVVVYVLVDWVGALLEETEDKMTLAVAKAGIGAFIYLEILDASFSFDGIIGAFALTNNIFIIALGLGTGAFAVRGLTLMLVDKGTLSEFKYLEHGAFYAIGTLAILMGVSTFHEIPEIVTGTLGAGFIGLALLHSIIEKRGEAA